MDCVVYSSVEHPTASTEWKRSKHKIESRNVGVVTLAFYVTGVFCCMVEILHHMSQILKQSLPSKAFAKYSKPALGILT